MDINTDLRKKENRHETNPFMVELKGKMFLQPRANMIIAKGENLVNTETGEILKDNTLIGRRKIVDKSQFAKIYASEIAVLYDLTKPAQNVFLYLTKVMDYDNKAILNSEAEYSKIGYKTALSVTKGLKELIFRGIIAPHVINGLWWVNPTIVCKGERFAKYTEYLTEEEAKREQDYLMKVQGKKFIDNLPESIADKYSYASSKKDRNSINEEIHPDQASFDFDNDNPYS